jgi:hypothetical protein
MKSNKVADEVKMILLSVCFWIILFCSILFYKYLKVEWMSYDFNKETNYED